MSDAEWHKQKADEAARVAALTPRGPITARAQKDGRAYITPEDIGDVYRADEAPQPDIWREVLEVLGGVAGWSGAEDAELCAYVARWGPSTTDEEDE